MSVFDRLYEQAYRRLHMLPSLIVLVVVLVLLHDLGGAFQVIKNLAINSAVALVGGHQAAVSCVLWRTLPLALAAAAASFVICQAWIKLDELTSYIWISLIVLGGAVVGNFCYEQFGSEQSSAESVASEPAVRDRIVATSSSRAATGPTLSGVAIPATSLADRAVAIAQPSVMRRVAAIGWLDRPNLTRQPRQVQPLDLFPAAPGVLRSVTAALNQLLGYLVDYEPRLFAASVLAGGFVGWRLQRKLAIVRAVVSGEPSEFAELKFDRAA